MVLLMAPGLELTRASLKRIDRVDTQYLLTAIDGSRFASVSASILLHSIAPHSHSIVLRDRNALNFQCKHFPFTPKNRLRDPSENQALEFKTEFRPSATYSVSSTIGTNWSIHSNLSSCSGHASPRRKDRHALRRNGQTAPWEDIS